MATSPSTDNYYIGKGIVSFQKDNTGEFRDVGNVPVFDVTPNVTKLDHFSSRAGIKQKDRSVVVDQSATLAMTMDEVTAANLALAMMGAVETDTDGNSIIRAQTLSEVVGTIRFKGTNDVGVRLIFEARVSFTPSKAFTMIGDVFGQIDVTGEITAYLGSLGVWTIEDVVAE